MSFIFSGDRDDELEHGSMFGPKLGSWWLSSKKDPRFSTTGRGFVSCSGMHPEAERFIKSQAQYYCTEVPDDLEYGCMKD